MQHLVFEHDPHVRKIAKYFLWLQLGSLGLAVGLSLLTLILFLALTLWLYVRYQGLPAVTEKRQWQPRAQRLQSVIAEAQRQIVEAKKTRDHLTRAEQGM
jgi:hypothetical protein